jgi:hypothetical protein
MAMRGCLSLLTKERGTAYRTGLFLASAERDIIAKIRPRIPKQWPGVHFTIVAPQAYADEFQSESDVLWLEQVRAIPLRWLRTLRRRKFDLCIVLLAGRPTFRKLKMAVLLLNTKRIVVYNENGDSVIVDRDHWGKVCAHFMHRARRLRPYTFFVPFGITYLLLRTLWLTMRAKFKARLL